MIESLRKSELTVLGWSAAFGFMTGFVFSMSVQVLPRGSSPFEVNAVTNAWRVVELIVVFWFLTLLFLAFAYIAKAGRRNSTLIRCLAGAMYILSLLAVVASVSSIVFFMAFR